MKIMKTISSAAAVLSQSTNRGAVLVALNLSSSFLLILAGFAMALATRL
ncbi:MAG: hypothetical protein WBA91_13260 [Paracoccaceae bacterium]